MGSTLAESILVRGRVKLGMCETFAFIPLHWHLRHFKFLLVHNLLGRPLTTLEAFDEGLATADCLV